jgi:hypothetical protein
MEDTESMDFCTAKEKETLVKELANKMYKSGVTMIERTADIVAGYVHKEYPRIVSQFNGFCGETCFDDKYLEAIKDASGAAEDLSAAVWALDESIQACKKLRELIK